MDYTCAVCQRTTRPMGGVKQHVVCSQECKNKLMLDQASSTTMPLACGNVGGGGATGQRRAMLTVRGNGQVKVRPDRARVMLMVVDEAESANEVNRKVAPAVNELLSLLEVGTGGRATGVQTENLRIETMYEQKILVSDERAIVGYKVIVPLSFACVVGDVGDLIELVLQQVKLVVVRGIEYVASEALVAPAYTEALRLAVADAESQASVVLGALKLERRGVQAVEIHNSGYQHGEPMAVGQEENYASFPGNKALYASESSVGIRAPEGAVSASVTLIIAY